MVEPYSDIVNDTFLNYRVEISPSWDPFLQQENENAENEFFEIKLNEQTGISDDSDNNQNNQNY